MKNLGSLLFSQRTLSADQLKELPISAVLHKNVDLGVGFYDFVDLGDVLVEEASLEFDFAVEEGELGGGQGLEGADFDSHGLGSGQVESPLDDSKTALAYGLSCIAYILLS